METDKDFVDVKGTLVGNLSNFFYWMITLIVLIGGFLLIQRIKDEVNYVLGILIVTMAVLRLIGMCRFRIYLKEKHTD